MDISEVSLDTVQGHISEQQSPEKDLERAKAVLEQILQSDRDSYAAIIANCELEQDIEQRILMICDAGVKFCINPKSPYYAFGVHKRITDCAMDLRGCHDDKTRYRFLNECAEKVRTRVSSTYAKKIINRLYQGVVDSEDPMKVAAEAVKLLPPLKHEELLDIQKRYQRARV